MPWNDDSKPASDKAAEPHSDARPGPWGARSDGEGAASEQDPPERLKLSQRIRRVRLKLVRSRLGASGPDTGSRLGESGPDTGAPRPNRARRKPPAGQALGASGVERGGEGATGPWGGDPPADQGGASPKPRAPRLIDRARLRAARRSPADFDVQQTSLQARRVAGAKASGRPPAPPKLGPSLDELRVELSQGLARRSKQLVRVGSRPSVRALTAGLLLVGWALSGLYEVAPGERGEVTRFGALVGSSGPGLNYHRPWPIERVRLVSTMAVNTLDLGAQANDAGTGQAGGVRADGLMQTSDGDIVDVAYAVRWRVADPVRYLFGSADPDGALKATAESVMGDLVAQTPVQQVMGARPRLQPVATSRLQALMNAYGTGVAIESVEIRRADPPPQVASAFHDAVAAGQAAQLASDEASAYRARSLDRAKADAGRIVSDAQGQVERAVVEARGQAAAFGVLDAAYRKAPEATRRRLYLDTMRWVLDHSAKIVVDPPKGVSIVLQPGMVRDPSATQTSAAAFRAAPSPPVAGTRPSTP